MDSCLDLSVTIITKNEEENLGRCLESLPLGCEIIVVDSGSTDQTRRIAQGFSAQITIRNFDDYASQKNAAMDLASRTWVFSLDADECMDLALRNWLMTHIPVLLHNKTSEKTAKKLPDHLHVAPDAPLTRSRIKAYRVSRSLVFLGTEMSYGKTSDSPIRLFRKGSVGESNTPRFVGRVHEELNLESAEVGRVKSGMIKHYSYKNLHDYFKKFNHYTDEIAQKHFESGKLQPNFVLHQFRPWVEFFSRYFLRLGFLDGKAGYTYALVSSLYTYIKYEKLREVYNTKRLAKNDQ